MTMRPLTIGHILDAVCHLKRVDKQDVMSDIRHHDVVAARALYAMCCKMMTNASYPEIARGIGRKHHSTLHTAHDRMKERHCEQDRNEMAMEVKEVAKKMFPDHLCSFGYDPEFDCPILKEWRERPRDYGFVVGVGYAEEWQTESNKQRDLIVARQKAGAKAALDTWLEEQNAEQAEERSRILREQNKEQERFRFKGGATSGRPVGECRHVMQSGAIVR